MKLFKAVFLVVTLICSVLVAEPIEITFENGTKWTGEIGQSIVVHAVLRSKETTFSGKLERVTDSYLIVDGEFINVSDVLSITLKGEQQTIPLEGAEEDPTSEGALLNENKEVVNEDVERKAQIELWAREGKFYDKDDVEVQIASLFINSDHVIVSLHNGAKLAVIPLTGSLHNGAKLAVIPLTGKMGFVHGEMSIEANWFDAGHLEAMFKKAKNAGMKIVVLEINSQGGSILNEIKFAMLFKNIELNLKL